MGSRFGNLFGIGPQETEKEKRQRTSRENRRKGKAAEDIVARRYGLYGYEVKRTGRGSDIHVTRRDLLGKVVESKDIEVKSGSSQLSKLQEETRSKKKGHYKVERVEPPSFFYRDIP
jgi:hypothetical protein